MAETIHASKGAPCEDLPGSRIGCPSHEPLHLSQINKDPELESPVRKLRKMQTSHQPESLLKSNGEGTEAGFGIGPVASPKASLGSTLGLIEGFDEWMEGLGESRNHRTDQEWVDTYLEDNSKSIETKGGTLQKPPKEVLVALGYTSNKADEISAWIEAIGDDYREHRSPQDWAKTYTRYELQCGRKAPSFSPPENPKSEWRPIDITRESTSKIPSETYQTKYIHLVDGEDNSYKARDRERYPPRSDEDFLYLYHATTHETADDILRGNGLVSTAKNDFSYPKRPGFYMSTTFSDAWQWARIRPHNNALPAILVFKVRKRDLSNFSILHLNNEDGFQEFTSGETMVDLEPPMETMEIWKEVLQLCRVGKTIRDDVYKLYMESQAVHGYMCRNGGLLSSGGTPEKHSPRKKNQYCILSGTMFRTLIWRHIDGVLWFAAKIAH